MLKPYKFFMASHLRTMGVTRSGVTQLLAAQHKWAHRTLTPASKTGTQFIYPRGTEGWVDLRTQEMESNPRPLNRKSNALTAALLAPMMQSSWWAFMHIFLILTQDWFGTRPVFLPTIECKFLNLEFVTVLVSGCCLITVCVVLLTADTWEYILVNWLSSGEYVPV